MICLDPEERFRQVMPRNAIGWSVETLMPGLVGGQFCRRLGVADEGSEDLIGVVGVKVKDR